MPKNKILLTIISLILLTGCSGKYQEGTYEEYVMEDYGGQTNKVTAKVEVNSKGKITSVYLDSTYTKDGVETTKKTLGYDYGMKSVSANMGKISGGAEWFEQVKSLEQAVVDNQGIDFIELKTDETTDSVAGCTIKIGGLYEALEKALQKAKK